MGKSWVEIHIYMRPAALRTGSAARPGPARAAVRARARGPAPRRGTGGRAPGASALSGVWMNTVGERPSRSQPTVVSTQCCQPSTVSRGGVAAEVADDRPVGQRPRPRGASAASSSTRPARRRWSAGSGRRRWCRTGPTRRRRRRAPPRAAPSRRASSKNARWRTSTAYRWAVGSRRRKPARAPTSAGANEPGSWIQRAWARGPSGSIASRKIRSGSSTPASRRSCVIDLGQLEHEPEAGVGLPRPGGHRVAGRRRVEGGVALDRVAPAGVGPQALLGRQRMRQEAPLPGLERPHRASHMKPHDPTLPADVRRPPRRPLRRRTALPGRASAT